MRCRLTVIVLSWFVLVMAAPAAHADPIEKITATAEGVVPASATLTLNDPQTTPGLAKVCVTSRSQGELFCIAV